MGRTDSATFAGEAQDVDHKSLRRPTVVESEKLRKGNDENVRHRSIRR